MLVLYSEVMPYTVACLRSMVARFGVEVHVVRWDKKVLTPYVPPVVEGVSYYLRSSYSLDDLKQLLAQLNPDLVFTSGWMDKDYIRICEVAKGKGIPVVTSADTHWAGSWRQRIGTLYARIFFRRYFDFIMVPGAFQFEFARKIGFRSEQILFNFYSADVDFYSGIFHKYLEAKKSDYPRNILYLGRFAEVKNIGLLISVFEEVAKAGSDWNLILIGNGPLENSIPKSDRIKVHPFTSPQDLEGILAKTGIFCLPSKDEPWGVVVHEMASCGIPLLISDVCGAGHEFVRNGLNGFRFKSGDHESLREKMERLMSMNSEQLIRMGVQSNVISKHISPEGWASELYSIMK